MNFRPLFYLIPFLFSLVYCEDKEEDVEVIPQPIGILAFPPAQQLSPLISFGQNIFNKGQLQVFYFGDSFLGPHKQLHEAVPNYAYAISDNFAIYAEFPSYAISSSDGRNHSSGLEDAVVQLEYAYYSHSEKYYSDQVTLVAGFTLPTGSASVSPPIGFGNLGIFLGTTLSRTGAIWYYFSSYGALLSTSENGNRVGNIYLYQAGIGRYITTFNPNWLCCWLVEVDGFYQERNKFNHQTVHDSGGNTIYITPSIWFSSCNWRFQFGAGYAVQQHLFGDQSRNGWLLALSFGYTFW